MSLGMKRCPCLFWRHNESPLRIGKQLAFSVFSVKENTTNDKLQKNVLNVQKHMQSFSQKKNHTKNKKVAVMLQEVQQTLKV